MTNSSPDASTPDHASKQSQGNEDESVHPPTADAATQHALDHGDNEKIDQVLDELDVSTTDPEKISPVKQTPKGRILQARTLMSRMSEGVPEASPANDPRS
ncbi:hypothetical protein [Paraburkholderia strydomiana]|jgi:hypothetical protein|uniref:Uncharacterized protein n=1 Tax=Paraburkholderia strydomiana TaxID=1245417 RepID=A0ABW9CAU6_9BURK